MSEGGDERLPREPLPALKEEERGGFEKPETPGNALSQELLPGTFPHLASPSEVPGLSRDSECLVLADVVCASLQQPQDISTASLSWGLRARVLTLFFLSAPGVPEPPICDPHLWLWAAPRLAAEDLVWSLPGPFLPSPAPRPLTRRHSGWGSLQDVDKPLPVGPHGGDRRPGVCGGCHTARSWGETQCRPVPLPQTGTPKSYLMSFTSHRPPVGAS